MKPPTANQITAELILNIPRRFRDSIVWRNNSGRGIGWNQIRGAVGCLKRNDIAGALKYLTRPMTFGLTGSPDIIGLLGPSGRFFGIEVKADDDKQSPEQIAFQLRSEALGGIYILARDVEEALNELEAKL